MTTRAQELIDGAVLLERRAAACHREQPGCWLCETERAAAAYVARAALLATLRKQHLRLVYFSPDAKRRALREQLRIALDTDV